MDEVYIMGKKMMHLIYQRLYQASGKCLNLSEVFV